MPLTFAEVIFPQRLTQSFTYRIPTSWHDALNVGHWVLAPFGKTVRPGFVVAMSQNPPDDTFSVDKIRDLEDHLTSTPDDDIDPTLIGLAEWMANYYIAPLGLCFKLIQPPHLPFQYASRFRITPLGQQAIDRGRLSVLRKTILDALNKRGKGLTLPTIKKLVPTASRIVIQLKRQKWIEEVRTYTVPSTLEEPSHLASKGLNSIAKNRPHQRAESLPSPRWWKDFQVRLKRKSFSEYFTDTSSTNLSRLLVQLIRETLDQKRNALVVFPDMAQATFWANFLRENLGTNVCIFHSGLSKTTQMKEWRAIHKGTYQIVVGTRSSVFVPLPSLGLIFLSKEDAASYKEEQAPHYHTREVARERAHLSRAIFLLHSPHPSLETVHHFTAIAKTKNEFSFSTPEKTPTIQVVDHLQIPYGTTLSDEMRKGIEQALSSGGGAVIFHNRKGFSSSVVCRDCGMSSQCENCRVPYKLLTTPPIMRCPYCAKSESIPLICPNCSSSRLEPSSFGTERLEQELRREFPEAKVGRMDRDYVKTESAAQNFRDQFKKGMLQIIVGTEMLFHGVPLAPVRFIGIPFADTGLHLPDFRSAERLYHHLQSVINLASTSEKPAHIVLQTRLPVHHVMQAVTQQEPFLFYNHELAFRQAVCYPPFVHFIQTTVSGKDQSLVQEAARQWVQVMASQVTQLSSRQSSHLTTETSILGPIPSQTFKHRHVFRETILFKVSDLRYSKPAIRRTYEIMSQNTLFKGVLFGINVDPVEVL